VAPDAGGQIVAPTEPPVEHPYKAAIVRFIHTILATELEKPYADWRPNIDGKTPSGLCHEGSSLYEPSLAPSITVKWTTSSWSDKNPAAVASPLFFSSEYTVTIEDKTSSSDVVAGLANAVAVIGNISWSSDKDKWNKGASSSSNYSRGLFVFFSRCYSCQCSNDSSDY
jgi:hypothetical protein